MDAAAVENVKRNKSIKTKKDLCKRGLFLYSGAQERT